MKKLISILCVISLLFSFIPAFAESTRTFTDSLGRTVTIPEKIERIAVTSSISKIVIYSIAPDLLVGITEPWDDTEKQYIDEKYHDMTVLGQLYGGKGGLNLEELLSTAPQVVIDIGEPKEGIAEDMDDMQNQTGIVWVHISAYLESLDQTYEKLGELLGREEEGKILADYCRATYDSVVSLTENQTKASLLYVLGDKGLNVLAKGSYHAAVIDQMADNLAAIDNPLSRGTGNEVDMEQILLWNPEIVIFSPESIYETVHEDPVWQCVAAIRNGTYYEVPLGPFHWLGMPPSAQRLLGMLWLGKLLYPDTAAYDLQEKVTEYFKLFYHYDLTQEQYDALMKNAL